MNIQRPLGSDYEFRFLSQGIIRAVHVVRLPTDAEACTRAYKYLEVSPEFDGVVVRSGFRFMWRIDCVEATSIDRLPERHLA